METRKYLLAAAAAALTLIGTSANAVPVGVYDASACSVAANASLRDTDADGVANACDPDLNQDAIVDFRDLGILKERFFTNDADADFNGDGMVNFGDLAILKDLMFTTLDYDLSATNAVPVPATLALMLMGLGVFAARRR